MDLKAINELIRMMESSKLTSMELEWKDLKIKLEKDSVNFSSSPTIEKKVQSSNVEYTTTSDEKSLDLSVKEDIIEAVDDANVSIIKAPMVGTFYSSATPNGEPYVKSGTSVKKGDTLCIIEAMKLMNEIEAELDGIIVEVLVKNGDLVEYGQPLFKIS